MDGEMMKKIAWLFAIAILLVGCPQQDPETPKPNVTTKDDITMCAPACAHVEPMGCPEAQPLVYPGSSCQADAECPEGVCENDKCAETCEMLCEALVTEGRHLGLECWQTITECEQIESVCR
jgi:hypothetical protein